MPPPAHAYLVCATPRSGSTLLCETPARDRRRRAPARALRGPPRVGPAAPAARVLRRRRTTPACSTAARAAATRRTARRRDRRRPGGARILADGTTPNGVWGGKLMWGHVDDLVARARELRRPRRRRPRTRRCDALLGGRRARVRHAPRQGRAGGLAVAGGADRSRWRAGARRASAERSAYVVRGRSTTSRRQLEEHDAAWRAWFARTRGRPLRGLLRRPRRGPARARSAAVLEALGLPSDGVPEPATAAPARRALGGVGRALPRRERGAARDRGCRARPRARSCARSRPRRCTSSARSSPSSSGRCCCSAAARTRSRCCASPRRRSAPAPLPFPVLHVDTGHNFPEVLEFRDRRVRRGRPPARSSPRCRTRSTPAASKEDAPGASRNRLQTTTLLDALEEHGFDAAFGGARRDEERARAKERVLSFRDEFGQWEPRAQRAEPWALYNGAHPPRRAHPRLPAEQLDRARRVALHRGRGARAAVDLLRPPRAACSSATGSCSPSPSG